MDRIERKIISHYFKKYKNNEKYKSFNNNRGIFDGYIFTRINKLYTF